jgi:hypothetical protein
MTDIANTRPVISDDHRRATEPHTGGQPLGEALSRVRRRGALVVTERWLVIAGGILMPLGLVFALLAWYGAAHTTRLFEQVPYLISGGIIGLIFVLLGAALYFGYWLSRLLTQERETVGALLRIEELLATRGADGMGTGTSYAAAAREGASAPMLTFVATKTGDMYHRADCPVVASRNTSDLRTVTANDGLRACGICLA